MILDACRGMFGQVQVVDGPETRSLLIGPQVQGAVLLDQKGEPTGLPESRYCCALLALASQPKNRRGLVAGLGSGAGIVGLLGCAPELRLTVVEIDPVVVALALRWFPEIRRYIAAGRLELRIQPFEDFQPSGRFDFDFCILDAYGGANGLTLDLRASELAAQCADDLWVNYIGQPTQDVRFTALLDEMRQVGMDPEGFGQAVDPTFVDLRGPRNLIVTSADLDLEAMDSFVPFPNDPLAEKVRRQYREFCETWITRT